MKPQNRFAAALLAVALLAAGVLLAVAPAGAQDTETVPSIELDGEISPATAGWIGTALDDAAEADAPLAIIRLDTPGGLDSSMREIVQDILAAPMPVVVYVAPNGARAASAGVFITQAADVAAMAPETNIGSASPITSTGGDIEGTLGRKITNDAAAFLRALAGEHGRNPELAEQMVSEATNVSAREALEAGLIDLIASDQEELLEKLDGFEVQGPKQTTLDTSGYAIEERDTPLRYKVLQVLVDPNVAFLLLLIGLIGITLEILSPGAIIPGVLGAAALVLGLIGTLQLPVAAVGVALLVLAFALIIAEAHLPTGGLLGVAGIGALIAAGLLLFEDGDGGSSVSPWVAVPVAIILGGGVLAVGQRVLAARRREVRTGEEELLGSTGRVRVAIDPVGQVFADGALWRARAADDEPIGVGASVRIEAIEGLTLIVVADPGPPPSG
ncbi:MAG TPA: nodulation protein NfeD [Solirubrobacterales bacterium]|nr:nodulation protein NfeD [Solirubrobacterales bacterium]